MSDSGSAILDALYQRQPDRAAELAAAAAALTVWEAAALGRDEELGRLLAADPALADAPAPDGHTPLGLAAYFAPRATAAVLLAHGARVSTAARNTMQVQPLHAAVAAGNAGTVTLLLEHDADVNARQQAGYTPLMGAAAAGRADLIDLLLARGADRSAASDDGSTAATMARARGHHAVADRLDRLMGTT